METIISIIVFAVLFILACLSLYRICTVGKTNNSALVSKKDIYDMRFAPKIKMLHVRVLALLVFGMILLLHIISCQLG